MGGKVPNVPESELLNKVLIQGIWGGFGRVYSALLKGKAVVVKHYSWNNPDHLADPIQKEGLLRKIASYHNELAFYSSCYRERINAAHLLGVNRKETSLILIFEDGKGLIPNPSHHLNEDRISKVLSFLADLHANTLQKPWPLVGNYWHYNTRKAEWNRIRNTWLKKYASRINDTLENAQFTCLIHGDSKASNYLMSDDANKIVPLDFQYFGTGIGVMDLVCFCSGIIPENDSAQFQSWVNQYFQYLKLAMMKANSPFSFQAVKQEWSGLIPLVWADYARFLEGWTGSSFKLGKWSDLMVARAQELLLE
ncbi:MAG: Ser/Thr protein kinase RdoA (MazF antagonist) [Sphingobacteriales bacterium]|jgi:Ser/Thr protein kinase RdoA (MazF antagonist)